MIFHGFILAYLEITKYIRTIGDYFFTFLYSDFIIHLFAFILNFILTIIDFFIVMVDYFQAS